MTTEIITIEASEVQTRNEFNSGLLERFIAFAEVMPKSAATYRTALNQMNKFFTAQGIEQPTRVDLLEWRKALITGTVDGNGRIHSDGEVAPDGRIYRLIERNPKEGKKLYLVDEAGTQKCLAKAPSTIQLYISSAKVFFKWTAQEKLYPDIAAHMKAGVKINHEHKKDALTATQAGSLIQGVKGNSLKSKRDRAILALMVATGVRCIEVNRADVRDMTEKFGRTYLKIQGKGHDEKDSEVLIPAQVVALIQDYLKARGNAENLQPLFTSTANRNRGSRLSSQAISMQKGQVK